MAKVSTNISIDPVLKEKASALFAAFGMDLSTGINLFLSQSVREQRIPFEIKMDKPSSDTLKALDEYQEMKSNKEKYKRYDSFDEVLKDL